MVSLSPGTAATQRQSCSISSKSPQSRYRGCPKPSGAPSPLPTTRSGKMPAGTASAWQSSCPPWLRSWSWKVSMSRLPASRRSRSTSSRFSKFAVAARLYVLQGGSAAGPSHYRTLWRYSRGVKEAFFAELSAWLAQAGLGGMSETDIVSGFCDRCVAAGLPLARALMFIDTLHPVHEGRLFRWGYGPTESPLLEYGRTS